ncbi:MAG: sugar ABC transporter ATP-binding protein [Verrucomicrobia bacterium]|nr:sugar ABC transporter ATP-binding protein [Verrucomicrobiota bacterium]
MSSFSTVQSVLKLENITKSFYGVKVLRGVNFDLRKGELHALLGENGAGKSTLIKIISGAYKMDAGRTFFKGEPFPSNYSPKIAEELGILTIYQHFHLVPHLTVAENLAITAYTSSPGLFVDWAEVRRQAKVALDRMRFPLDPNARVKDLSVAKKQMLEIAIALSKNAEIIIMDEPTAALSRNETESLFGMIDQLKTEEIGIIYVSHRLEEIKQIGDRVTILRDGNDIATLDLREAELKQIIALMIGREVTSNRKQENSPLQNPLLSIHELKTEHFPDPVSLVVREKEVLGITGLVGSGKTEVARALFGVDRVSSGTISVDGRKVDMRSPRSVVHSGIGYLPEDRDSQGLCLNLAVRENLTLALLAKQKHMFFDRDSEKKVANGAMQSLRIRARNVLQQVKYLSGGNKQKVVLGKWLEAGCRILILDEPTMGIDIGARNEIYQLIHQFTQSSKRAVIFISSDVDEILEVSDRILVMSNYHFVGELDPRKTSKQEIIGMCMSSAANERFRLGQAS